VRILDTNDSVISPEQVYASDNTLTIENDVQSIPIENGMGTKLENRNTDLMGAIDVNVINFLPRVIDLEPFQS
jgi:hypothetical protein